MTSADYTLYIQHNFNKPSVAEGNSQTTTCSIIASLTNLFSEADAVQRRDSGKLSYDLFIFVWTFAVVLVMKVF
ncbi:hypothetical protein NKF06_19145, partial [Haloferax sp. AB510]|uniref:hypothetical protein n=1 Tax=Haloferax sp. AB510 TaxID=2934172 RepID=UPI00209C2508